MRKYVRNFESFKNSKKLELVNEELLGGILNFIKGVWKKASAAIKKLSGFDDIKKYISDNLLNSKNPESVFSATLKEYNAKASFNDQDCFDLVSKVIDPDDSALGTSTLKGLYDLSEDENTKKELQFLFETSRNNTIVKFKYGGGPKFEFGRPLPTPAIKPELKTGKAIQRTSDGKGFVDQNHLPDVKKLIATLTDDKKKAAMMNWFNNIFLKFINDDIMRLENPNGESNDNSEFKVGDNVIYKRDKFDQVEWDSIPEDEKLKPGEGKMKELQEEKIGIKIISKIEGDVISFEGADFTKKLSDLISKVEGDINKSDEANEVSQKLGKIKDDPDKMKIVGDVVDALEDPSKTEEIKKIIGE